jgi:multicomponent Na+:H+ antiporter subunit E
MGGYNLPTTSSNKPGHHPHQDLKKQLSVDLRSRRFSAASFVLTFFIMALFWVLFSGKFDLFHICLGFASCLIVAALNHRILFISKIRPNLIVCWLRFAGYIPWLLYQIFLANLHVLYLTFHPKMHDLIDPKIIQFSSILKNDVPRTTFANSITLTPGTIAVHVSIMGKFSVHCIDDQSGAALPGEMEKRIAKVFEH